ncbi:hypothetical protein [Roseibium sp.]|uniref:hypothetical protein n=1 Tax=Roseibium sp. TaxID=1936156 RepID=UPI003BB0F8E9
MTVDSEQTVLIRVIGTHEFNDRVIAKVFARKLSALISAIEAADRTENGGKRHEYLITDLSTNSPATATLIEQRVSKAPIRASARETFGRCIRSLDTGAYDFARRHMECVQQIARLAKDAEAQFDRQEIIVGGFDPVVIDKSFMERTNSFIESELQEEFKESLFKGSVYGSFDGYILETDLRGDVPKVILRLTAGGKEIDCSCPGLDVEEIRQVLNRRVRLEGQAFYDGKSGLPTRIEIRTPPKPIREKVDFTRWKGAFDNINPELWSGDD